MEIQGVVLWFELGLWEKCWAEQEKWYFFLKALDIRKRPFLATETGYRYYQLITRTLC